MTYQELYRIALTWTDDKDRAKTMVERYFQGQLQGVGRAAGCEQDEKGAEKRA